MKSNTTFWLALFAAALAGIAIVLRLMQHGSGDLFGLIGPAGIILLMLMIMSNHRPGRPNG